MRRLARGALLLLAGLTAGAAPAGPGPARAAGTGPAPAPAPRPAGRLGGAPRLAWVASWEGDNPSLFVAGDGGDFVLTVFGDAKLNGRAIGTPAAPTAPGGTAGAAGAGGRFWIARLGTDGALRSAVAAATPFLGARALGMSDGGDVLAFARRSKDGPAELARIRPDGALLWSFPVDAGYNLATSVNRRTGRLAFALTVKDEGTTRKVRVVDEQGQQRLVVELQGAKQPSIDAIALRPDGGLVLAAHVWAPSLLVGPVAPIELGAAAPQDAAWVVALDARGAAVWSRALTAAGRTVVKALELWPDGTVSVTGECEGDLHAGAIIARAPAVPPGDSAHRSPYTPYALTLKGSTGEPTAARRDAGAPEAHLPWLDGADLEVRQMPATTDRLISAVERGARRELWRTRLGAHGIHAVAALRDGAFLVHGLYDLVLTAPDVDPPAVLVSGSGSTDFLALYAFGPGPKAPPAAPEKSAPPAAFSDVRRRALAAFRGKRFDAACELYAQAQRLQPAHAANMVDLALCLQRQNDTERAVRANRYAIRLASGKGQDAPKNESVRYSAYYNLGRLESGPDFQWFIEPCMALESWFGCARPVHACGKSGSSGGTLGITDYTFGRFALDPEEAKLQADEYLGGDTPELGDSEDKTTGFAGQTSYDIVLQTSSEGREWNKARDELLVTSQSGGGCRVVHTDGCAGNIGLACAWQDDDDKKPRRKVVELTFGSNSP